MLYISLSKQCDIINGACALVHVLRACVCVCVLACVCVDKYMHGQEPTSCVVNNGTSQAPCHMCMTHSRLSFPLLMRKGGSNDLMQLNTRA